MARISRREFASLTAAAAAPFAFRTASASPAITAQDVVDRIKKGVGVEWKTETVDTLKAGDASSAVTGIVTTALPTMAVLQQAVKAGANMVITGHPTFFSRGDARTPPAGRGGGTPAPDPIFTAKSDFVTKHNLVVFRLSDHWRVRQPNPMAQGIVSALGWTKHKSEGDPLAVTLPAQTLTALAQHVARGLRVRGGIRVIGEPGTSVRRVGLLPGSTPIQAALKLLPQVDVIVAGEMREWEGAEYARDQVFSGAKKGLILVGRIVSEEPGMDACAAWLKTLVKEVPVRHIPAGDPYWRPAS
jgi:putative NIF3 family GTP cyclohydrolase 1 type 2